MKLSNDFAKVGDDMQQPVDFYRAGLEMLEEQGTGAGISTVSLCDRLGVSRGSFYHHFDSFDAYVERFLDYWVEQGIHAPAREAAAPDNLTERSANFIRAVGETAAQTENAIRVWSSSNDVAAETLRRVDRLRVDFVRDSLMRAGADEPTAELYAQISVAAFVGLQVRGLNGDQDLVEAMFQEIEAAFLQVAGEATSVTRGAAQRTGNGRLRMHALMYFRDH